MLACVIKTNLEISAMIAVEVYDGWLLDEYRSILGVVNLLIICILVWRLRPSLVELISVLCLVSATHELSFLGFTQ